MSEGVQNYSGDEDDINQYNDMQGNSRGTIHKLSQSNQSKKPRGKIISDYQLWTISKNRINRLMDLMLN